MIEFKKYKLGDIADIIVSTVDKKSKPEQKEVRLCNFVDVYKNWAITHDLYDDFMIATASDIEIERFKIKKGQVAFTKDSETRDDIGIATYIAEDFDDVVLGYHTALVTPHEDIILGKYLNAFMHSKYILKYFEMNATGSGMRYTLSLETLNNIPILAPSLEEQKKIGDFFSSIDRKIALNRKADAELESLAKQIYDYWFVQFDFPDKNGCPYKSSKNPMIYNKELKREIPADWEKATLLDIACYTNGLACQNHRPKKGERQLPVIKIKEMRDGYSSETEAVSINIPESIKVHNGDILFSWSASLEVMQWAYGVGGLNQHIFKVTGKNGYPKAYYYFQILNYVDVFRKIAESRKTTMGHITQDHLKQSKIAVPKDKSILEKFESLVKPLMDKQVKLTEEITSLKSMRDFLLPLLMTGQLSIS